MDVTTWSLRVYNIPHSSIDDSDIARPGNWRSERLERGIRIRVWVRARIRWLARSKGRIERNIGRGNITGISKEKNSLRKERKRTNC